MGFSVERSNFIRLVPDNPGDTTNETFSLAFNVFKDLQANGFTLVSSDNPNLNQAKKVVFQPTSGVDPLVSTNPWRIYLEVSGSGTIGTGANAITYPDTGLYMKIGSPQQIVDVNNINSVLRTYPIIPATIGPGPGTQTNPRIHPSSPMAYRLTIVPRGFVLAAWQQNNPEDLRSMGLIVVQRGVGCGGSVVTTGQTPLYLVTNISPVATKTGNTEDSFPAPKNNWYYQIIREKDTIVPNPDWNTLGNNQTDNTYFFLENTIADSAERKGNMLHRFPIRWQTPVTADTGEYLMIFPFGLCSARFAYTEEIDLIAVSKADAYQSGQTVPLEVYGDSREYTAYNSNNINVSYNGGVRLFILTSGGGI